MRSVEIILSHIPVGDVLKEGKFRDPGAVYEHVGSAEDGEGTADRTDTFAAVRDVGTDARRSRFAAERVRTFGAAFGR